MRRGRPIGLLLAALAVAAGPVLPSVPRGPAFTTTAPDRPAGPSYPVPKGKRGRNDANAVASRRRARKGLK